MPRFRRLLAKASDTPDEPRPAETLLVHTRTVIQAAEELLRTRALASLRAAGLDTSAGARLTRIVLLAAFLHDLGKASDHFQAMVRKQRRVPQLIRHEALVLWLAWPGQPLSTWLRAAVDEDVDYLLSLAAAAGHHRKFWSDALAPDGSGAGVDVSLMLDHEDFGRTLRLGVASLGLPEPTTFAALRIESTRRSNPGRSLEQWEDHWNAAVPQGAERILLALAKALVLAADVAGSCLAPAGHGAEWIGAALSSRASGAQLERLVTRRLRGKTLRTFQEAVAASEAPVTLVRAGCASGKTVAAYLWAARRQPGRQLWVTYPTTGTATEGFRDYVFGVDIEGRLAHSRADVDLELLGLAGDHDPWRERDRLDSIRAWSCDVVTCTVDTVLGLMQNARRGVYAWPGLADSAVVFDEVHAYDDSLWGNLVRFLRALPGIPCLLMTASLPQDRLGELHALVREVHRSALPIVDGPPELEQLPRYQRVAGDPHALAREEVSRGRKVLWVSNTVARCMKVAERFDECFVYHSRFRYRDRVTQHAAVVNAFRAPGRALASTTQVAEISLDLHSVDLLVTDLALIPSMIQRLGRLKREASPDTPGNPGRFVVLEPERADPYTRADLDQATEWLDRLGWVVLSQRDLTANWVPNDRVTGVGDVANGGIESRWLDGGFRTEPGAVRDATPGLSVLLEEDVRRLRAGVGRVAEYVLPMPSPPDQSWRDWKTFQYLPVAPEGAIDYDQERGAQWRRW